MNLADSIFDYCYDQGRRIITDPDDDSTGEPTCDGQCGKCSL